MAGENSFGDLLRQERERIGWRQEDLADKFYDKFTEPVHRVTVNKWENGVHRPSVYRLEQLISILAVNEEAADAFRRAAGYAPPIQEPPQMDEEPPIIDNLPFQRNPFFTGREEHLERLRKQLQETGTAEITQPISISGLAGIGKTELALEYAHHPYPNVYRAALWVNAADKAALQASYDELAEILKLPERNEQKRDRRIQAVKDWLKTHTNWLLIMDNADDLPLAQSFLPSKPLGHVVFTTRSQIIGKIPRQIEIEEMEPAEGLLLLLRRSHVLEDEAKLDTVVADVRDAALDVVELLGGHPLALDQAGAYIEEARVSFTYYVQRYHAQRRLLLSKRRLLECEIREHPESVVATLELSFHQACVRHPLAADILHFCAFLQPDAIPEELFQYGESFKYGTTAFDDAIAALHRYSLIKRNVQHQTFSVHRLLQAVLIDAMSPDLQNQWRERVVRAINRTFPMIEPHLRTEFKDMIICERLLPYVLFCAKWTDDGLTPTVEVAELFHKAGTYRLYSQSRYLSAERLLTKALSIYEHLGVEHLNTASALHDLAYLYFTQGKDSQAAPLFQHAVAIREKQLGAEHPGNALTLHYLSLLYHKQGEYGQAESLYRRVLRIWDEHLGAEDPSLAFPLYGLAVILHDQGKYEQAEAFHQRGRSVQQRRIIEDLNGEQRIEEPSSDIENLKRNTANFLDSIGLIAGLGVPEVDD